jgi:hypothetical protein
MRGSRQELHGNPFPIIGPLARSSSSTRGFAVAHRLLSHSRSRAPGKRDDARARKRGRWPGLRRSRGITRRRYRSEPCLPASRSADASTRWTRHPPPSRPRWNRRLRSGPRRPQPTSGRTVDGASAEMAPRARRFTGRGCRDRRAPPPLEDVECHAAGPRLIGARRRTCPGTSHRVQEAPRRHAGTRTRPERPTFRGSPADEPPRFQPER